MRETKEDLKNEVIHHIHRWKIQYYKNIISPQNDLWVHCSSSQNPASFINFFMLYQMMLSKFLSLLYLLRAW